MLKFKSTAAATISTDFSNLDEPFPLDASSIDLDNDTGTDGNSETTSPSPINGEKRKSRSRTMPSISLGMHYDDLDFGREVVHKNSDASGSGQGQ